MTAVGIEAAGIGKHFGAFAALSDISMKVRPGTVHGLLGENGAGKSTLVKCLMGYYRADAGSFLVDGREAAITRPADADALGLGMVYQHFTLVPSMTVAENLVIARGQVPAVINWARERAALDGFMGRMPFQVRLDAPVGTLSAGERQKTEILKQLYLQRRLLVLDEPTSVLTPHEADEMLGLMQGLAHAGTATVVIITHKLPDVMRFTDEVTVLRRGRLAGHGATSGLSRGELTAMMIGEPHAPARPERQGTTRAEVRLQVRNLRTPGSLGQTALDIASLEVRAHEVVGVAGVSGNGQRELLEVLGGQRPGGGAVTVDGVPYIASRRQSQALHVRIIPEEPLRNGCVAGMSVVDNLNLRSFDRIEDGSGAEGRRRRWLDPGGMRRRAARMIAAYGVRAASADAPVGVLSGGNVQRCVLARELDGTVALLVVANPCFGLDVKAVAEVRARLMEARNAGCAILLISEDLDEIMELADRIVVMRGGRIVHEAPAAGADSHAIGAHMLDAHAVAGTVPDRLAASLDHAQAERPPALDITLRPRKAKPCRPSPPPPTPGPMTARSRPGRRRWSS